MTTENQPAKDGYARPDQEVAPATGQEGGEEALASQAVRNSNNRPIQFGSVENTTAQQTAVQYVPPAPSIHPPNAIAPTVPMASYGPSQALELPNPFPVQISRSADVTAAEQSSDAMDTDVDFTPSALRVEAPRALPGKKKGKQRAVQEESSSSYNERDDARNEFIENARRRLKAEGINTDFIDFLEFNSATMVVTQLLDTMEAARAAAARERSRADLLQFELKSRKRAHPASPEHNAGPSSRPMKVQQTDTVRIERTRSAMPQRDSRDEYDDRRENRRYESEPEPRRIERRAPSPPRRPDYWPMGGRQGRDARPPPSSRYEEQREVTRPLGRAMDRPSAYTSRSTSSASSSTYPSPVDGPQLRRGARRPPPLRQDTATYRVPPPAPPAQTVDQAQRPVWPVVLPPGDSDDGRSTSEDEKPKSRKKKRGQEIHQANLAAQREAEDPGPLPDTLDSIEVRGRRMRDNYLWGMWGTNIYYSRSGNRIYAGEEAVRASRSEVIENIPYSPATSRLYAIAPYGAPMNPREARRLVEFATMNTQLSRNASYEERVEAFIIVSAFRVLVDRLDPVIRDRAMNTIASITDLLARNPPYSGRGYQLPLYRPITRPAGALGSSRRTRGAGLRPLEGRDLFDQERTAQYILHHGRPGTHNVFTGVLVDHAFRVSWDYVWGFTLLTILSPSDNRYRTPYGRVLVSIMMRPFYYSDAWEAHNAGHPDQPNISIAGGDFVISRFPVTPGVMFSEADVLEHLFENGIPPAWIHHSYLFAIRWWNATWTSIPDENTRQWLHVLFDLETESNSGANSREVPGWALVGSDPYYLHMPNRPDSLPEPGLPPPPRISTAMPAEPSSQVASSSATTTSTAVVVPMDVDTQTIAESTPAQSGPSASAADTARPGPAGDQPVGSETTMMSNVGEAPHSTARDPMDGKLTETFVAKSVQL
ncbi:hypothetical protein LshimejAT787_1200950 [Lyophyllum shimeji]|uniref:Uncharacterized protein n=1 Tax=Lyophyllum shimeji TaxID=47721 RepID=A0A9P3PWT7_LYOSH|nr:hypothetical protein LshimejAT787_1200950 [Lyophyllum shimeji]